MTIIIIIILSAFRHLPNGEEGGVEGLGGRADWALSLKKNGIRQEKKVKKPFFSLTLAFLIITLMGFLIMAPCEWSLRPAVLSCPARPPTGVVARAT